jgi:uncharacterized membrane protein YgaE (UPF0421/DUF939 family)
MIGADIGRHPRRPRERAQPLVDRAAQRSRVALNRRRESLVVAARPILHTSLAAAGAWLVATALIGHPRPFFAAVAAVVTLGVAVGRRPRRAVEIAIGVAVGIGVADTLVMLIGTGTVPIALVTGLAMTAALLLGGGPLLVSQAAISAVLVATLPPPDGFAFERLIDAGVGGAAGLLVAMLVAPIDPVAVLRRSLRPVTDALSASLESASAALEERGYEPAESALLQARASQPRVDALRQAAIDACESARFPPRRRRTRQRVEAYARAAEHTELALNNTRVLARGIVRAISLDDATPIGLVSATRGLARAADGLADAVEDEALAAVLRAEATAAAGQANGVLEQTGNMSALHLIGQVRSTAYDILRALDVPEDTARAAIGRAAPS